MKRIAAACLLLSGCAWVFQDRLPERYNKTSPPRCSTSKGLVALDGVFAVLNGVGAIALLSSSTRTPDDNLLLTSSIIWTVVHTASALSGSSWAEQCRRAQDVYDEHEEQKDREERDIRRSVVTSPAATERMRPRDAELPPVITATPRGFFCATSALQPLAGVCAREKDACMQMSAAIGTAVPDMSGCHLVESVVCFDAGSGDAEERCTPTTDACAAQRDRAIAAGAQAGRLGECVDAR